MKTDADPLLPLIQDGILARSTRYGRFDVFRVLLDDYMTIWLGANCLMQEKSVTSRNATPDKTACFDLYVTDEGESFYTVIEVDGDGESNYGEQHRRLFEVEGQEIISKLRERVQERELVTLSNPTVENNILVGSKVDQQLWTSIESELEGFVNSLKPIYPTMFGKGEDADTMNFFVVEPTSDNAVTVSGRCKQPAPNEVKRARQDGRVRWADNKKAIAVPVHVAGSPWIIIHFTLAKQKDNRSEAYQYYRELVPDVAEAIRRWARQQFRQRCTDAIRGAILRANSSDALVRQRVLESQLTIQLESVNRCLRGPSLKVASTQRHGSTIARVSDGRQAQVDIEIRVLSDQHQAEINLSDVESEDKLRAHMEQAANAVVAEISARSSEEAAVSAHILRTHIGEIRSLALDRGTQLEENIYRLALQMEHYLSATRMIFRGDAKVDESGIDAEVGGFLHGLKGTPEEPWNMTSA